MPNLQPTYLLPNNRMLLWLLVAVQFLHIVDLMMIMPLGPFISNDMAISAARFSQLVAGYSLTAGVAGLLCGFFLHANARHKFMLWLFALFALLTLATAFAANFWQLMACRVLTGFVGGLLGSVVLTIVAENSAFANRGRVIGQIMTAFSLATILGVPFALWLATLSSWRAPFIAFALMCVPVWLLMFKAMPAMPAVMQTQSAWQGMLETLRIPKHGLALLFTCTLACSSFMVIPFITIYNIYNLHVDSKLLPLIYIAGGLATLFSSPIIGKLSDRYSKANVLAVLVVLASIIIYSFTHITAAPFAIILFITTAFFVFVSGRNIPANALVSQVAPVHLRGHFMSIFNAVQSFSMSGAALLGGMLMTSAPNGALIGYNHVGLLAVAFAGVTLLLLPLLNRLVKTTA